MCAIGRWWKGWGLPLELRGLGVGTYFSKEVTLKLTGRWS